MSTYRNIPYNNRRRSELDELREKKLAEEKRRREMLLTELLNAEEMKNDPFYLNQFQAAKQNDIFTPDGVNWAPTAGADPEPAGGALSADTLGNPIKNLFGAFTDPSPEFKNMMGWEGRPQVDYLYDPSKAGDSVTAAGIKLIDSFGALNRQKTRWATNIRGMDGASLPYYYDAGTGTMILQQGADSSQALNALAARGMANDLDVFGQFAPVQEYALNAMSPDELTQTKDRLRKLYEGQYSGRELEDMLNREAAIEWAGNNLYSNPEAVRKLAYRNPELYATIQGVNARTLKALDSAEGMEAVRGQFANVKDMWDAASLDSLEPVDTYPNAGAQDNSENKLTALNYKPYLDERKAIRDDTQLTEDQKDAALKELDAKYDVDWNAGGTNLDPNGKYAKRMEQNANDIKTLKDTVTQFRQTFYEPELLKKARQELDAKTKELEYTVPGFDGDLSDTSKLTDIKLNNKDISNARYVNGKATGDLDDIVSGMGGTLTWDKAGRAATVKDSNGKVVAKITKYGDEAIETDENGNIIKMYSIAGGKLQADVADYAERLGVPLSYFHDKNGVLHAYAHFDMKDAPIVIKRQDDKVIIDAYINFNGCNKEADEVLDSIMNEWDFSKTNKVYHINGMNDDLSKFLDNDNVQLKVNLHCNKGIKFDSLPEGHRALNIHYNLPDTERSHVYTTEPSSYWSLLIPYSKELGITNDSKEECIDNLLDYTKSDEMERVLYNWKIKEPGDMWLNDPKAAAHEFLHLLGVSDAYSDFYRYDSESPNKIYRTNTYGKLSSYFVPSVNDDPRLQMYNANGGKIGDMARCQGPVSDVDVAMILDAWQTGEPQFFPKSKDEVLNTKVKWGAQAWEAWVKTIRGRNAAFTPNNK